MTRVALRWICAFLAFFFVTSVAWSQTLSDRKSDMLFTDRPFRIEIVQGSSISFFCRATMHWFTGTSRTVGGSFAAHGDQMVAAAANEIRIPVETLLTGIGVRDRLMWDLLRTDQHPDIVFSAEGFRVVEASHAARRYRIVVSGELTIRGVTRKEEIDVELTVYDQTIKITGSKDLDIREYQIEPPSFLGVFQVKPEVTIKWSIEATVEPLPVPPEEVAPAAPVPPGEPAPAVD